jgi:hypothetical protein
VSTKFFSIPLSFKNKINLLYKTVHPDVLGANCPNDLRKINEKSMQELNLYIESLDKGSSPVSSKSNMEIPESSSVFKLGPKSFSFLSVFYAFETCR